MGVAARRGQEGAGHVGADPEGLEQLGGGVGGELGELGVEGGDLALARAW